MYLNFVINYFKLKSADTFLFIFIFNSILYYLYVHK